MQQVVQNIKTGELTVEDVPPPVLSLGGVLVRNVRSLISAGTERTTVQTGQSGVLQKARQRPELIHKTLREVKQHGLLDTYHKVQNRRNRPKALGYSSAGVVIDAAGDAEGFGRGDRVACAGGGYASHAEIIFVPKNLCVPVPDGVDFNEASFTTLGAIAMQGVRQAEVSVGDHVTVIGLGLIGLLTVQILKASGCRVLGLDIEPRAVQHAREQGADAAELTDAPGLDALVSRATHGHGTDRVIIAAHTSGNEPLELAGRIARDRAVIVIVGLVEMRIPRDLYYEKDLSLHLSRSYGPGRYDPAYEEDGIDYPIGYVRWTEQRNMAAFLQLVADKKVNLANLISHEFSIEQAPRAYGIITGKSDERPVAVLLKYDAPTDPALLSVPATRIDVSKPAKAASGAITIGFIGAGSFAQSRLIPALRGLPGVHLRGVATARGINAQSVADKFDFAYCTTNHEDVLNDAQVNCVFIATPHRLHGDLAARALRRHKHVFVEKPLALSQAELDAVIAAYKDSPGRLMVGFNRRFASLVRQVKQHIQPLPGPMVIHYRVNVGLVQKKYGAQDRAEGGRILGEVCHFVDLIQFLTDAVPIRVYADAVSSNDPSFVERDNVSIVLKLNDGSLGVITYVAIGDDRVGKEYIEIHRAGATAVIDDFARARFLSNGRATKMKGVGKGHREEVSAFIESLKADAPDPISFSCLARTTATCLCIEQSLAAGAPVDLAVS